MMLRLKVSPERAFYNAVIRDVAGNSVNAVVNAVANNGNANGGGRHLDHQNRVAMQQCAPHPVEYQRYNQGTHSISPHELPRSVGIRKVCRNPNSGLLSLGCQIAIRHRKECSKANTVPVVLSQPFFLSHPDYVRTHRVVFSRPFKTTAIH